MKTQLLRRVGAGVLAIGLSTGLAACGDTDSSAKGAPAAAAPTTAIAAQEIDLAAVLKKAFEQKTTAHAVASLASGDQKAELSFDVDLRDKTRLQGTLAVPGQSDKLELIYADEAIYLKMPSEDGKYLKATAKSLKDELGSMGISKPTGSAPATSAPAASASPGLLSTGKYQRTETVDGEQLAVYAVMLDLSRMPKLPGVGTGRSAVPAEVWLDGQQRPRRMVLKDADLGKGERVSATVDLRWGVPVTVTVPPASKVTEMDLDRLIGAGAPGTATATPKSV